MTNESSAVTNEESTIHELSVPAEEGQLSRVRDFVTEICDEAGFTVRETNNTKLAVDEACTNIIKHAYESAAGEIKLRAGISRGKVDISIFDSGKRFDFAGVKDPDLDQYVETGRKGGLGVFLINRLMDRVEYRAAQEGNELFLTKQSQAVFRQPMTGKISWRGTLRYKFTLRASLGFLVLISVIWGYIFARQTASLQQQRTTQWLEKKRLAENVSNKSKELLLRPETYSIEQTTLTAFVAQILEGNSDLAYARVVDDEGTILSSGDVEEMFTEYSPPEGEILLREDSEITWTRFLFDGQYVRDIRYPVRVRVPDTDKTLIVGSVHLGVSESAMQANIRDPRPLTTLIIVAIFLVGVLLIMGLVSVFVKPIQMLTDGVRAIGDGSLDGKISVDGPAEIGAIAAVFNEISEKFKKAQESVLEQEKLQKEIEVAKQIQQALLPRKHPDVSGYDIAPYYQAAKEVGGDYYDFVVVDEDTLGVVVADVSGKGVPGSLVMTMIRTALRMEARGNTNASDVMSKMNDFVTDDMKKGMFVTMFYVILDSKNRIISYASAGHNPMILFRAESRDIFFLNPKGFPVGISLPDETLFRRSISLEKIKLKKDDMLLIYTDGVTEAMDEKREQYGEERLIQLTKAYGHLHPKKFIEVLERDIKEFTGGNAQNDDITVVAVKEKLTADEVLFGIRKKLIDMVDVAGMSVKEACAKMRVSPATYYRYKKRMALMGERGLKNKVLREDLDLKRASIEERRALLEIVRKHPDFGAKRIASEYNSGEGIPRQVTEKMVYEELRRLNLNTKELRIEYLKRNRLIEEGKEPKTSREIVEDLLTEVAAGTDSQSEPIDQREVESSEQLAEEVGDHEAVQSLSDVRVEQSQTDEGVAILKVGGHLDSVSSATLEKKLQEVISNSHTNIIVDLADVSYISSGGWGILVGEVRRLREQMGDVVLVGMTAEV
ncbi:MAG: anti-sigma factor antagonist, partial [Candidatus Krumholzibacteria bacterium]|nr:anti-sigma factor antagonist [Candidatus Krumholzibacteria bacterium]